MKKKQLFWLIAIVLSIALFGCVRKFNTLNKIEEWPDIKHREFNKAKVKWDTGITSKMIQGNCDYSKSLQEILFEASVELHSSNYRSEHELTDKISKIEKKARLDLSPVIGNGSMLEVAIGGEVIHFLESEICYEVTNYYHKKDIDYSNWLTRWLN